ncbi:MAG: hypothetical protein QOG96_3337, partial [Pseudonocardiales bacterium]|nr:hypothetical protein [Pseudonocardiales bacterium]
MSNFHFLTGGRSRGGDDCDSRKKRHHDK